jgi:hypothetical protein
MKDFFAAKPDAGAGESSRKIAIETVENNIKFIRVKILLNFFSSSEKFSCQRKKTLFQPPKIAFVRNSLGPML